MIDRQRIDATFISTHWDIVADTNPESAPVHLLEALCKYLPHIEKGSWDLRFQWGGIYVNGKPARMQMQLPHPCRIEYYEPRFDIEKAESFFPGFEKDRVIFEDDDLISYIKPSGLPCLPAREQPRFNLKNYLEIHTKGKVHMPSRLDMSTSGVVVASKSLRTHKPLQRLFEDRKIEKRYYLETSKRPPWDTNTVTTNICQHTEHPVLRMTSDSEGKAARTTFKVVSPSEGGCVIAALPKTGRTHQIRVHISSLGFPFKGVNFYGGEHCDDLHLFSFRAHFLHPISGSEVDLRAPRQFTPKWLAPLFP